MSIFSKSYWKIQPSTLITSGPPSNMIFMVDYGLAVPYIDNEENHVQFCDKKQVIGTAR